jgi:hypothetical protein
MADNSEAERFDFDLDRQRRGIVAWQRGEQQIQHHLPESIPFDHSMEVERRSRLDGWDVSPRN